MILEHQILCLFAFEHQYYDTDTVQLRSSEIAEPTFYQPDILPFMKIIVPDKEAPM